MELTQDASSVYFLHPSDNTGIKLVTTPFDGTCYGNWKRSMVIGLTAKNKMCFVDGTLAKPEITAPEYNSWSRCNIMITGWIITALDPQIAASILYMDSARAIWLDLEERFGQVSSAQLYALEQEVSQISQDTTSISEYYTHLKKIWDEIDNLKPLPKCECANCTCDITQKVLKLQQDQRLMIFLMKMSNEYANVRSHILMMDNLPLLPQAYRMLLQEQRHKEISKSPAAHEPVAFAVDRNQNNYRTSTFQKSGNGTQFGKNAQFGKANTNFQQRKVAYFCDYCKIPGHSKERCFKLNGYPPGFKPNQPRKFANYAANDAVDSENTTENTNATVIGTTSSSSPAITQDQYNQLMTLLGQTNTNDQDTYSGNALLASTCLLSSSHTNNWIIDSGASDHLCSSLDFFYTFQEIHSNDSFITIPDGTRIRITHIGNIKLTNSLELTNVLYASSFKFNLISVHKLVKDTACTICFNSDTCVIQGHSMNPPLLLGKLFQGLYFAEEGLFHHFKDHSNKALLSSILSNPVAGTAISSKLDEAKLFHLRLGHIPYSKLHSVVPNIDSTILSDCICAICPAARQHRLSFGSSEIKTTHVFDLLHIDVWGPYHTLTHNGCRYFLTIVDDYSRATWVHLMKSKLDSVSIIQTFLQFVKTQFNSTVKIVRTDNALELCHGQILHVYHTYGILHQTSCSATPQQNGVVERKHKHLMETARALFFQSNVPSQY